MEIGAGTAVPSVRNAGDALKGKGPVKVRPVARSLDKELQPIAKTPTKGAGSESLQG